MTSKNATKVRSDKDKADDILRDLRAAMPHWANGFALIHWLAREKRSVRNRVLDALRGPRKVGAPKKLMSDELILYNFEAYRAWMEGSGVPVGKRLTDLEVIKHWLTNTSTRFGRESGVQFREHTQSGKAEVKRIRDACVRAKRNRKKASQKV